MLYLLIFIFGAMTPTVLLPIADKLLEVLFIWLESLKVKPKKKILESNKDSAMMSEFIKPAPPIYDICEDDDFEDFEDD